MSNPLPDAGIKRLLTTMLYTVVLFEEISIMHRRLAADRFFVDLVNKSLHKIKVLEKHKRKSVLQEVFESSLLSCCLNSID